MTVDGVGVTSVAVAAARALESQRPDSLVNDPWAATLVERSGVATPFPAEWPDAAAELPEWDRSLLMGASFSTGSRPGSRGAGSSSPTVRRDVERGVRVRVRQALVSFVAAVSVTVALSACAPEESRVDVAAPTADSVRTDAETTPAPILAESITFLAVVDGDTIETSAGTVRLIGVDTPERGECGHDKASDAISSVLAPGDLVTLELPVGQNDQDKHGRLLRYVTTSAGVDLGLLQVQQGNAVARYDSSDGYPAHPRESDYHAAQLATVGPDGSVIATGCQAAAAPPAATDRWWEQFTSCTKLKRNDLGLPIGPFSRDDPAQADIYDWFAHRTGNGGDGDGDGLACE